jgi:hypothetical protein
LINVLNTSNKYNKNIIGNFFKEKKYYGRFLSKEKILSTLYNKGKKLSAPTAGNL